MKRSVFISACALVCLVVSVVVAQPAIISKPRTTSFLDVLQKGQNIIVKDNGAFYEVTIMKLPTSSHKVVEIGEDYFVVEDITKITRLRIPIYSVKSIKTIKLGQ